MPATAMPARQTSTPKKDDLPEAVGRILVRNSPRKMGGTSVPKAAV